MNQEGNINLNNETPGMVQIRWSIVARYINIVFIAGIDLYPTIIHSLKRDVSMQVPEKTNDFNSILYIGAVFGVLSSIFTSSYKKSRLLYLNVAILTSLIGWIWMYLAKVYASLVAGRAIVGFSMGIHSVAFYFYIYENLFTENRFGTRNIALSSNSSDFFNELLFIILIGWTFHWRNVILAGILYHVYALFYLWTAPESPHILHRHGEVIRSRTAFSQLAGGFSNETRHYYDDMIIDVVTAMVTDSAGTSVNIPTLVKTSITFIIQELMGIICYYCYLTMKIEEGKPLVLFIVFVTLYEWNITEMVNWRAVDFCLLLLQFAKLLGNVSLLMGLILIVQHYCEADYIVNVTNVLALQFYFLSYTRGWICAPHILFKNNLRYYETIKIVAPALLCKFLATFFLMKKFDPFSIATNVSCFAYCYLLRLSLSTFIPNWNAL